MRCNQSVVVVHKLNAHTKIKILKLQEQHAKNKKKKKTGEKYTPTNHNRSKRDAESGKKLFQNNNEGFFFRFMYSIHTYWKVYVFVWHKWLTMFGKVVEQWKIWLEKFSNAAVFYVFCSVACPSVPTFELQGTGTAWPLFIFQIFSLILCKLNSQCFAFVLRFVCTHLLPTKKNGKRKKASEKRVAFVWFRSIHWMNSQKLGKFLTQKTSMWSILHLNLNCKWRYGRSEKQHSAAEKWWQ